VVDEAVDRPAQTLQGVWARHLEPLHPDNHKVPGFVRRYQDECVLVLANLSRFVQGVELDLAPYKGLVPVEIFGRTESQWWARRPISSPSVPMRSISALEPQRLPAIQRLTPQGCAAAHPWIAGALENLFIGEEQVALEAILPTYLKERRWFGGKARKMKSVQLLEAIPMPLEPAEAYLTLVQVDYAEGDPDLYVLPLTATFGEDAARMREGFPHPLLAICK
jgi:maltose alpha-D-glucosyltransferase/alpha-amylase